MHVHAMVGMPLTNHARLWQFGIKGGAPYFTDVGSSNGSLLNGYEVAHLRAVHCGGCA